MCVFNTFEGVSLESDEHTEFPCLLFFSFIQVDMFTLPDFLLGVVVTNQYPVTSDMCPAKSFSINLEAAVAVTRSVKLYKMLILWGNLPQRSSSVHFIIAKQMRDVGGDSQVWNQTNLIGNTSKQLSSDSDTCIVKF